MTYISDKNHKINVPLGNINGYSSINKFGANLAVTKNTTEDIWDNGGFYPFPSNGTAPIVYLTSSSVDDSEPIEIQGLDFNGDLTIETITLNGIALVALTTPLWRIFRMKNMGVNDNVGSVRIVNADDSIIYGLIRPENNQTLMALYTIPKGKTALINKYYATVVESTGKEPKSTRFGLWMRDTTVNGVFQIKHAIGIPKAGSMVEHSFDPYAKITELVDIKMTAQPDNEDADVAAGFDLYLIDN